MYYTDTEYSVSNYQCLFNVSVIRVKYSILYSLGILDVQIKIDNSNVVQQLKLGSVY